MEVCKNCGKEISPGVAFCTECGKPIQKTDKVIHATSTHQPIYQHPTQPVAVTDSPVVSTGTFFGLMFLFAIPVIGWIVCIIMSFAAKNKNKKHFAKAMLIWLIIGLIFSVISYFVFRWLGSTLIDYINSEAGGQFGDLQDFFK